MRSKLQTSDKASGPVIPELSPSMARAPRMKAKNPRNNPKSPRFEYKVYEDGKDNNTKGLSKLV